MVATRILGRPDLNRVKTAVFLGDSITQSADDATGKKRSYPGYVEAVSLGQLKMLRNAGVGGETSAQMLARVATQVVPYKPDYCVLLGFTNDSNGALPNSDTLANLSSIYALCYAAGIQLVVIQAPPLSTDTTKRSSQMNRNAAVEAWCADNKVVHLSPWGFATDTATGGWAANYSPDEIHPKQPYYATLARALVAGLGLPKGNPKLALSNNDAANKIANGLFLNGTDLPTGWNDISGTNNTTGSIQAADFARGNSLKLACPVASTGQKIYRYLAPATAGRVYEFECLAKASSFETGLGGYGVLLQSVDSGFSVIAGSSYRPAFDWGLDGTVTIRGQYVAAANAAYVSVGLYNGGIVGGFGTVEFAQVTMRDLTANGFGATDWPIVSF